MKHLKHVVFLLLAIGAAAGVSIAASDSFRLFLKEELKRFLEEKVRRAEHEKWAQERTAAELAREREWRADLITPCPSFGRGLASQVCIEQLGPESVTIGTPVAYRVRWRNLPSGAYIRVWSRNAAPAGQRWRYMGAQGAVAPLPLGGTRDGDVRVTWDGRSTYCAPSDLPMMCDEGEVGRYVLRAAVMTGSDPFWPSWPQQSPIPVGRLAQSETRPFTLDGPPQPVAAPGRFRSYPAHASIVEAIRKALPSGSLGADWYVERRIERLGQWRADGTRYCARLDLDKPLAGWINVCFPRSRRDANGIALAPGDITARSEARLAQGVMSAEQAKTKATTYAIGLTGRRATFSSYPSEEDMVRALYSDSKRYDGSYQGLRDAARDAGLTYVEVNQPWPSFRDDPDGSWWLVEMGLWINTIDGPRVEDWGRITLRVDHDGTVCRVDSTGEREGQGRDRREVYSSCRPGSQRHI